MEGRGGGGRGGWVPYADRQRWVAVSCLKITAQLPSSRQINYCQCQRYGQASTSSNVFAYSSINYLLWKQRDRWRNRQNMHTIMDKLTQTGRQMWVQYRLWEDQQRDRHFDQQTAYTTVNRQLDTQATDRIRYWRHRDRQTYIHRPDCGTEDEETIHRATERLRYWRQRDRHRPTERLRYWRQREAYIDQQRDYGTDEWETET